MTTCPRIDVTKAQAGGTLTLDGVVMHRPAFAVTQVSDLWLGAPRRGNDLTIPGAPGVLSLPRRRDVRKVALPMVIDGRFLHDGTASTSELGGIKATLSWLGNNVVAASSGDSTRALVLTDPDGGDDLVGRATVEGVEVGVRVRGLWLAVLDLTLPAGHLLPA